MIDYAENGTLESLFVDEDDDELTSVLVQDDDEELREDYDDDDDEEFLPFLGAAAAPFIAPLAGSLVQQGARAVNRLFQGPKQPRVNVRAPHQYRVAGSNQATVMTQKGPLRMQFPKPFATTAQLNAALEGVRKDISAVRTAVRVSDDRHRKAITAVSKSTATAIAADGAKTKSELRKLERRLEKKIDDTKQLMLMMTLMGDDADDDSMLPIMLMMNGGGDNNMFMMLALSKAFD